MTTPTSLQETLRRDEGCRSSAYQDSRGFWTIGIGICIDARANCGLTDEEIQFLFNNRVTQAKTSLLRDKCHWSNLHRQHDLRHGQQRNLRLRERYGRDRHCSWRDLQHQHQRLADL
jgi:GH24 family phage-related lysozyme (muramidase)